MNLVPLAQTSGSISSRSLLTGTIEPSCSAIVLLEDALPSLEPGVGAGVAPKTHSASIAAYTPTTHLRSIWVVLFGTTVARFHRKVHFFSSSCCSKSIAVIAKV